MGEVLGVRGNEGLVDYSLLKFGRLKLFYVDGLRQ